MAQEAQGIRNIPETARELFRHLDALALQSRDPQFTQNLEEIRAQLAEDPGRADELRMLTVRNYGIYAERLRASGTEVPLYWDAVNGDAAACAKQAVPRQIAARDASGAPSSRLEFALGGVVLSICGAILVLTAGTMLAVLYLSTLAQGILMYAVCIALALASELAVRRALPKLSDVLTAIALSGLYLVTVVNKYPMENFGLWTAGGLLLLLSVAVCIFGWKRGSFLYSTIGFVASYVAVSVLSATESAYSETEYILLFGTALASSVIWLIFPVAMGSGAFSCVMITANVCFMGIGSSAWLIMQSNPEWSASGMNRSIFITLCFVFASWLVLQIVYLSGVLRRDSRERLFGVPEYFYLAAAGIYVLVIASKLSSFWNYTRDLRTDPYAAAAFAVTVLGAAGAFLFLFFKGEKHWQFPYFATLLMGAVFAQHFSNRYVALLLFGVILLLSKGMLRLRREWGVAICDLVMSGILMILMLDHASAFDYYLRRDFSEAGNPYLIGLIYLVLAALGIWLSCEFVTTIEMLLTVPVIAVLCGFAPDVLGAPIALGVLLLMLWLISHLPSLRGKHPKVFGYFTFACALVALLAAVSGLNRVDGGLMLILIAVFGTGLCWLWIQPDTGLVFRGRYSVFAVFASYLVLMWSGISKELSGAGVSAVLMGIALVCVGIGFGAKLKDLRITGLVLSMLVCAKVILFDSFGASTMGKTLLFFLIGVLALTIAAVYMVLEKKLARTVEKSAKKDDTIDTLNDMERTGET